MVGKGGLLFVFGCHLSRCVFFSAMPGWHVACSILAPWPGIKPAPLQWKRGVLTSGPPGKSARYIFWAPTTYLVLDGAQVGLLSQYPQSNMWTGKKWISSKWLRDALCIEAKQGKKCGVHGTDEPGVGLGRVSLRMAALCETWGLVLWVSSKWYVEVPTSTISEFDLMWKWRLSRGNQGKVKVLLAQLCPTFCDSMDCVACQLLCPWDSSGMNTGVGCHSLL